MLRTDANNVGHRSTTSIAAAGLLLLLLGAHAEVAMAQDANSR
jgi:hypothetical protein